MSGGGEVGRGGRGGKSSGGQGRRESATAAVGATAVLVLEVVVVLDSVGDLSALHELLYLVNLAAVAVAVGGGHDTRSVQKWETGGCKKEKQRTGRVRFQLANLKAIHPPSDRLL